MSAHYGMNGLSNVVAYSARSARRHSTLLLQVLVGITLTIALGRAISSPAVAASSDVVCEPNDVCRIVQTRLPLRALPRVNSNIF